MSETEAILVTLRRICEELEIISTALRSLLDLMQAHKVVSDSEETDRPPAQEIPHGE